MKKSIAAIRTMKAMEEINARLDLLEQMMLDTMSKAKREKYLPSHPLEIVGADDIEVIVQLSDEELATMADDLLVKVNDARQAFETEGA